MLKNINNKHWYNMFFILFLYYIVCKMTTEIEGFNDQQQIILMGDSVFANDKYVKSGYSVFDVLHREHENVLLLAKDHATVEDLLYQFSNLPVEYNDPSTVIFVSCGGNDILHYFKNHSHIKEEKFIDNLFSEYRNILDQLYADWGLKARVFLCTIYFPRKSTYKKYYNMITLWNEKLRTYASEYEHTVVPLDNLLNNDKYFTHAIEPSELGAETIANRILEYS